MREGLLGAVRQDLESPPPPPVLAFSKVPMYVMSEVSLYV